MTALKEEINKIKKPFLMFDLFPEEDKSPSLSTYFGGKPYITDEKELQICPVTGKKLNFVGQILMPDKKTRMKKLYSIYFDFDSAKQDKDGTFAVNVYQNPDEKKMVKEFEFTPSFDKHKVKFFAGYEIPQWDYLEEAFPGIAQKMFSLYGNGAKQAYSQVENRVRDYYHDTGFKIKGYPTGLYFDEVPKCPKTGKLMEPFVQMESVPELGIHWIGEDSFMVLFKSPDYDYFAIKSVEIGSSYDGPNEEKPEY